MKNAIEYIDLAIQDLYDLINDGTIELNEFNKGRLDALTRVKGTLVAINENSMY